MLFGLKLFFGQELQVKYFITENNTLRLTLVNALGIEN